MIPRAVDHIFDQLKKDQYTASTVSASYLEIYNEDLSDLLGEVPSATPRDGKAAAGGAMGAGKGGAVAKEDQLQLLEEPPKKAGARGRAFVKNLSEHEVQNPADVLSLIAKAQARRRVGETLMNTQSSRSHCVFTLTVFTTRRTKEGSLMESTGKLHLVDLAGSECARTAAGDGPKSAAGDARERERKNINQSLLTLGRVISSLKECTVKKIATESVRIPYRDSKLTRLLQEIARRPLQDGDHRDALAVGARGGRDLLDAQLRAAGARHPEQARRDLLPQGLRRHGHVLLQRRRRRRRRRRRHARAGLARDGVPAAVHAVAGRGGAVDARAQAPRAGGAREARRHRGARARPRPRRARRREGRGRAAAREGGRAGGGASGDGLPPVDARADGGQAGRAGAHAPRLPRGHGGGGRRAPRRPRERRRGDRRAGGAPALLPRVAPDAAHVGERADGHLQGRPRG